MAASCIFSSSARRLVASPKLLPNRSAFPSNASSFLCLSRSLLFSSPISFQSLPRSSPIALRAQQQRQQDQELESVDASLLPPKLRDIIALFQSVPEPKAKYQQLLHYGARLPPLDPAFKTDAHRVRGCVSQVWVRAFSDPDDPTAVRFEADSDSALTKGLAALLVFGLSGSPATVIARVPPDFVQLLGLRQSLTPSRNNGFLNMLKLMQQKAVQLYIESAQTGDSKPVESKTASTTNKEEKNSILGGEAEEVPGESASQVNGNSNLADKDETSERDDLGGRRKRIIERLQQGLSPSELEVEDVSYLHAGHAGVRGSTDGETHFNVRVISKEFEGKSLVKRHRLIYDLLQEELQSGLHALSIDAKTPSEAHSG
ncbi:sufE-like protein 1, chloroplastic/mitochondrial [Curcuma longa]|uniref:sufE-like protein 1, chloroplastic/mitochondrial n=1 Tax=Curcuma longa TaxID=136217 RepID=UPI003D9EC836